MQLLRRLGSRVVIASRSVNSWGSYALLVFLLLLPQAFSYRGAQSPLGLARVHSGDEPHYLVQVSSLVRDGDLDISNNYEWAAAGEDDAGLIFRGQPLQRHMSALTKGGFVTWSEYYRTEGWKPGAGRRTQPPRIHGKGTPPKFRYSWHPEGIALLLAPVWAVAGSTTLLEPAVVFGSALATLVAVWAFYLLAGFFTKDRLVLSLALFATFLGTPLWHYSRAVFTEPYLACFAVSAYAIAYRSKYPWLAGIPIGLGVLMKVFFVILAVPLVVLFLYRRRFRDILLASIFVAGAGGYFAFTNATRWGSPFAQPIPTLFDWTFPHFFDILLDGQHGLLPFAPIAALALVGWVLLLKERTGEAWAIAVGALLYYLVLSSWEIWGGGFCYGPRYLVPLIPLLMIGLVRMRALLKERVWANALAITVAVISVQINALGALPYWRYWSVHPFEALFK
jgi:hypothetical protein